MGLKEKIREHFDDPQEICAAGFSLFDIFHIVFAIVFISMAAVSREGDYLSEISFESIELIFACLLIAFISSLAENAEWYKEENRHYTYAWLVCSASLLTPEVIDIPRLLSAELTGHAPYTLTAFSLVLTAFVLLCVSLHVKKSSKAWPVLNYSVFVLIFLSVVFKIVSNPLKEEGVERVLECIAALAPLFPIASSVYLVASLKKQNRA